MDIDTQDQAIVMETFERAAEANLNAGRRKGSALDLPDHGRLLMSGDLHDHGLNFLRLMKLADLDASPDHHLILHEIVHGPGLVNGCDLSVRMLVRVAALKLAYPDQVHLLQANHDLAQMLGESILKDGTSVVESFDAGLDYLYDDQADDVRAAMNRFIRSYLLAVRCANGIFTSHSLPSPRKMGEFDPGVLDRVPSEADMEQHGSAYKMVWGRRHTQELDDTPGKAWGVKMFIMGHQPAEMGYEAPGDTMLILASDHDHGVALRIDLGCCDYDQEKLINQIVPLAAVTV
jgi:hypothetical protein